MAAMSISTTATLYNPAEAAFKYDLISSSILHSSSSTTPALHSHHLHMGPPQRLPHHPSSHSRLDQHSLLHHIQNSHKRSPSTHLADKLESIMSNPLLIAPLAKSETTTASCQPYVYTAPCEHHPCKSQTDYLVNDMFPKLKHDLSTIEFGIRIADFMPLAFKTVPVAGLAEKELQVLNGLGDLPNVIQLQDSFVNDNGDTVLVLPMLKKFDCHAVNKSLCSVRKSAKQVLTGLAAVHAKNIAHLDINPSNIMVTHAERDAVIIDFGLSMVVDRTCKDATRQTPACGTTGYIAPEILNPHFYDAQDPTLADLYSFGVVLGQMLEPYIPDCDLHYFGSKYLAVENTNQTVAYLKEFIAQEAYYPRVLVEAADLLCSMLEEDPKDRKSAQELLDTHPFFAHADGSAPGSTLMLCDWLCRVQEIKYQKYLIQEQRGCEIYRYR